MPRTNQADEASAYLWRMVERRRKQMDLTIEQAAKKCDGISSTTYRQLRLDPESVRLDTLRKVAHGLGLSYDALRRERARTLIAEFGMDDWPPKVTQIAVAATQLPEHHQDTVLTLADSLVESTRP